MDGIVNWKPSWNNCSCFTVQQRINIYVHFANGIISTVGIMIKNCDLERLILQLFIIYLEINIDMEFEY